jgi:hypothetical protein
LRTERATRGPTIVLVAAAAVLLSLIVGINPANAAGKLDGTAIARQVFTATDPKAAYERLSSREQAALRDATMVATVEHTEDVREIATGKGQTAVAAHEGCWGRYGKWTAKSLVGVRLYSYWQTTFVCWSDLGSGPRVYSVWIEDIGTEILTFGWRQEFSPASATYNAFWEGRGRVQYYFALGSGGFDIQHATPCGRHRLNANGHDYISDTGCNLL